MSGRQVNCRTGTRRLRLFGTDRRGVAALEFALLFPIMVLMLVGTIEIANLLMVQRRLTVVTQAVADLVSQFNPYAEFGEQITAAYFNNLWTVATRMMAPAPATSADLGFSIAHVAFSAAGGTVTATVSGPNGWVQNCNQVPGNSSAQFLLDDSTNPDTAAYRALHADGTSTVMPLGQGSDAVIIVRIDYVYRPLSEYVYSVVGRTQLGNQLLTSYAYARPRVVSRFTRSTAGGLQAPCT